MRKIIQITAAEAGDEETSGTLYALADDGTVWFMVDPWRKDKPPQWNELPPLPEKKN